jgi:opacity protein-like surface antigen
MKTLFLPILIIFVIVSSQAVFSQGHFGVKGGVNLANLHNKDLTQADNIIGYQAGVVYYSNLENPLFFQTGLLYNVKGTKVTEQGETAQINLNYLELPLNVGFQIPVGENFKISPFVGGFVGYAISGKLTIGDVSFKLFSDEIGNSGFDENRIDYGANAGLGLHLSNRLILSGQYAYGLGNLGSSDSKTNTRTATVGLTFLF